MDWFGTEANGPLVATRAVHFAATAIMAGTLVFRIVVAAPVLRRRASGRGGVAGANPARGVDRPSGRRDIGGDLAVAASCIDERNAARRHGRAVDGSE